MLVVFHVDSSLGSTPFTSVVEPAFFSSVEFEDELVELFPAVALVEFVEFALSLELDYCSFACRCSSQLAVPLALVPGHVRLQYGSPANCGRGHMP